VTFLIVAVAGAGGAVARFALDGWIQERTGGFFPWGTFVINVSGSLILGFITGLALYHGLPEVPRVLLGIGFCGAYTTFSTFGYETVRLAEGNARLAAGGNALGSMVAGITAAAAGIALSAAL
jgi:fluoride exporter